MPHLRDLSMPVACLLACSFAACLPQSLQAENWPSWRGPTQNGISNEAGIPVEFAGEDEKNVAWKIPLPGPAGATPIVWGDRIFLTAPDEEKLLLLCFNRKGEELWRVQVGEGNATARGDEGNSCSPSPVTDGEHVWSFMGTGDLGCYDFEGNKVWHFNLQERYGKFDIQFGMSSTPVLDGDKLYMAIMHGSMSSGETGYAKVICLDKSTGKEVYAVDRKSDATHENTHSYASPILYQDADKKYLIVHGGDYTTAHRLKDGSEIWRVGDMNPEENYNNYLRFVASPSYGDGVVVCPTAKNGPVVCVDADSKGNVTHDEQYELWRADKTTDVPSPLVHNGLAYICRQDGNIFCVEARSGEEVYPLQKTHRQRHRASPVYVDGHILLTARDGRITVIKAGRDFEIVAENELGEDMSSSPVISDGVMYLRSFNHLWAIKK
ncbi:PQQ-binding-like beta-propeller repeat protein [Rubinisphaera sp. JC750]|uniref:outer membrane protein assembly factor BamB family protein n=1 Tax=Rubinisphaera sp. JC750 TaxID=2898658 RepID=UPI001F4034FB|nr:PQQ-binding-like beta-propeller repeat protein [Rubinisphaera sp. JC750]